MLCEGYKQITLQSKENVGLRECRSMCCGSCYEGEHNDAVEMTIHINVLPSVAGSTEPKVVFYFTHG